MNRCFSCTLFPHSLNNWHHFLTFPQFTAPSPHTSSFCLRISAGRIFLAFTNRTTNCASQVAGFFFFYSSPAATANGGKKYERILRGIRIHSGIEKTIGLHRKHARYQLSCYGPSTLNTRASCIRESSNFILFILYRVIDKDGRDLKPL